MGLKAKSNHFSKNNTAGGESQRGLNFPFNINLQLFAFNEPDKNMPIKGKLLYDAAENQSLKNQIAELYRPGANVGDGGTADALREEIKTKKLVGGKSHYIKAKERVRALKKLIGRRTLSSGDEKLAKSLIDDLENALKGWG